ncbi:MAG: NTP transferase domain-containing protein [Candidatus Limnocylindrales bacterium]|nr:NTP transferase domain-containing protein [Candidatus Limnocylindrales bacterium]
MQDRDRPAAPAPIDLGQVAAIIPVRGLERAKTRLGEALDPEERHALVEGLLRRTIEAAVATPGIRAVAVVSPDPEALAVAADAGAVTLPQGGGGLNEGLADGRAWAREMGATALLVIPADLPAIRSGELRRILEAARDRLMTDVAGTASAGIAVTSLVVLVPDRAHEGTNVLLVAPPGAIPFRFGPGSRAAHAAAAARGGAVYLELEGPLALDLDTPDDLLDAEALGLGGPVIGLP